MRSPTAPRRPIAFVLLAGALTGLLAFAGPAAALPVRKQIKQARKDLVAFEKDLEKLVEAFDHLQEQYDKQSAQVRSLKKILHRTSRAKGGYEEAVARWLIEPLVKRQLDEVSQRKEISEALLPQLRHEIWTRGAEREDKIDTLEAAIELLEQARSGDLVTKAGVGGGDLITYSADWEAVSMCESTGRWHINVGLFDGGLQFLPSTWWGFGGGEYAHYAYQATKRQQIDIAERVLAVQGPNAWPNCFKALPADTDE
jgi:hypothetical protein